MATQTINAMSVTWNNGATVFAAIKKNVTDSNSDAASTLIQLQVGGVDKFAVRKDGRIAAAGDILLTNSDAGAAAGPTIELYRDSASPANSDVLGRMVFSGEDNLGGKDTYAEIYATIVDRTATSEDGSLLFRLAVAGSLATALTLTGTGINGTNIGQSTPAAAAFTNLFANELELTDTDAGAAAGPDLILYRFSATPAASDVIGRVLFQGRDSASNREDYSEIYSTIADATSTSEDASVLIRTKVAGAMTTIGSFGAAGLTVTGALLPTSSDGGALGSASLMWSDAFLAAGGVINFNNGDVTITHSSGLLTFSGNATIGSGSAGVQLSAAGAIEIIGAAAANIDFRNDATDDYNARILVTGGTAIGNGTVNFYGGSFAFDATTAFNGANFAQITVDDFAFFNTDGSTTAIWDINRRTINGVFTDTGKTHSRIALNSGNGSGSITFATSNTNNTIASTQLTLTEAEATFVPPVNVGTYVNTGATAGSKIFADGTYGSSKTSTGANTHFIFVNGNGIIGSITSSGTTTTYSTTSDARLKTNPRDFDSGAIIDAAEMHHFDWRAGGDGYGPFAQDLYEVFSHAVTPGSGEPGDEDFMPWGVDSAKLVPVLWREAQRLRHRVRDLETRLAA